MMKSVASSNAGYTPLGTDSPGTSWTPPPTYRDTGGAAAWMARWSRLRTVRLLGVFALGIVAHQLIVTFSGVDNATSYSLLPTRLSPSSSSSIPVTAPRQSTLRTDDPVVQLIEQRLAADAPLVPYRSLIGTRLGADSHDILAWLLFHIHAGFDHFVVHEDGHAQDTLARLLPLVELGWVSVARVGDASHAAAVQSFAEWDGRSELSIFLDTSEWRTLDSTRSNLVAVNEEDPRPRLDPALSAAIGRFEQRYPPFQHTDFTLSLHQPTFVSGTRKPLPNAFFGGETLVIDSTRSDIGYVEVVLKSAASLRYLPVTYHEKDGSASFVLPSVADATAHELIVTRQYAAAPDPAADPVSQCSAAPNIAKWPEQLQLQRIVANECKYFEPEAWRAISKSFRHPRYRGEVLFHRFFTLQPEARASLPPVAPLSLTELGQGQWRAYPLSLFPSATPDAPRMYTCERFPRIFQRQDWDESAGKNSCGNETELARTGILRWTPDAASSFADVSLTAAEVKSCIEPTDDRPKGLRVVLIGDSVVWHTMLGLSALFDQLGISIWQTLTHHNFQYEMFDLVRNDISANAWEKMFSWEFDAAKGTVAAGGAPDVIVFNVGLWAISWGDTPGCEAGLRQAFVNLRTFADKHSVRIFWRETTAVFPSLGPDPLYQVLPRVQRFNAVANALAREFSFPIIPAFSVTRGRADAAHDNAHTGPLVQGDMAELLMYSICKARPE